MVLKLVLQFSEATKMHGWEFALSLIPSSLFRSKSLILESFHDLLLLLFEKGQQEQITLIAI